MGYFDHMRQMITCVHTCPQLQTVQSMMGDLLEVVVMQREIIVDHEPSHLCEDVANGRLEQILTTVNLSPSLTSFVCSTSTY